MGREGGREGGEGGDLDAEGGGGGWGVSEEPNV